MTKALHEAKVNLSWVNQDPEYIAGLDAFLERILAPGRRSRPNQFVREMERFLLPIMYFGVMNSVAQTLLKITCPGVPDIYQGTELLDFSLVDPDNRRPVDFDRRRRMMADLHSESIGEMLDNWRDGRAKLWTTVCAMRFRREHARLFQRGRYLPLQATEKQEHIVAFAREHDREVAVVAVPRLFYTLMKGEMRPPLGAVWGAAELSLPPGYGEFVNVLTGEHIAAANGRGLLCREVFARFPVALLASR
jgi:(1->4)-alpha-D-glucan 1-alpha-D-glucosylmutase